MLILRIGSDKLTSSLTLDVVYHKELLSVVTQSQHGSQRITID